MPSGSSLWLSYVHSSHGLMSCDWEASCWLCYDAFGDGAQNEQTCLWMPAELHIGWWLGLRAGRVRLGAPRPQTRAGGNHIVHLSGFQCDLRSSVFCLLVIRHYCLCDMLCPQALLFFGWFCFFKSQFLNESLQPLSYSWVQKDAIFSLMSETQSAAFAFVIWISDLGVPLERVGGTY